MQQNTLLDKVKTNLIIAFDDDDELLTAEIAAATAYAEDYQHLESGYYASHEMSPVTEQGVIMMASHLYESRDGSTGGFFADSASAAGVSMDTIHLLLRMGRTWTL